MSVQKFKPLLASDQFKGLDTTFSNAQYAYGDGTDSGADQALTWYLVERDTEQWNTDDLKQLFMSLGLARENDVDEDTLIEAFGAVDWYNGKTMLIASIPQSAVGSYVDGSTVELRVPTGTSSGDYVTFYGTNFQGKRDDATGYAVASPFVDSVYGGASCILAPNSYGANSTDVRVSRFGETPYSGTIDGVRNPNAGLNSWAGANTDNKTFYPHLRAVHFKRDPDDGRDTVWGIGLLEKGLFVLFDDAYSKAEGYDFLGQSVTGSSIWNASSAGSFVAKTLSGGTAEDNDNSLNRRAIQFTGSVAEESARLFYRTVTQEYKLVYFCHAGQNEFNSTTNHTYDQRKAYFRPDEADDLWITEIALYDGTPDNPGEVLAYAKLSEPVQKNQLETITFKVELNIGSE